MISTILLSYDQKSVSIDKIRTTKEEEREGREERGRREGGGKEGHNQCHAMERPEMNP
jgi:hypothetical protein